MKRYEFLAEIPAEEYHRDARDGKFLSSHLLGDFRKCPRLYQKKLNGEIEASDSAAFLMGRAVHTLVLEGRGKFDEEFMVSEGPVNPKTGEPFGKMTKAYREWAGAQTLPVISGADFGFIAKLQQAVWTHPVAARLLDCGVAERTVRTEYLGVPSQIRMDWFIHEMEGNPAICDLKTCDTLDWFESDARKFGYPEQLAFYREVFRIAAHDGHPGANPTKPACYLIAVEKREPYRVAVYKLTDELLDAAQAANERAIEELKRCCREGLWPTRTEELRIIDL